MTSWPRAALAATLCCYAQTYIPGPQVFTFLSDVDNSDQPYALYVPKHYDPANRYPLVICLHGAGSNHRLTLRRVFGRGNLPGETDSEASRMFPPLRDVDFLVACPLARGTMGYQGIAERDVYAVLEEVERRFSVDEDRVYLTGMAMGGGGTLWLGLTRPDVWAAIAPVCPEVLPSAPPGPEALAANALNLPVHLFHGERDPLVPVEVSRDWHKRLVELGAPVEYTEYPGIRHNAWDSAYRGGRIFDWFAKFRRNRFPDRVRFVSAAYRYARAYWVQFDRLTPGTPASIDARFTGKNTLEISTGALDGFTLRLAGHPQYSGAAPLLVTIDDASLRLKAGAELSFARESGRWTARRASIAPGDKGPGAEGPIEEAVASRHLYVYGTLGATEEQLKKRRAQAAQAAEWSSPRARLLVSFRVVADKDVTDADLRESNLVLFGTKETNTLIARLMPEPPLALNPSAADYGLVFVAPDRRHYVLVNSGLNWWTGARLVERPGLHQPVPPFGLLDTFQDYILFRGSLEDVVVEGRFDSHWRLPAEQAETIRRTGAAMVR